MRIDILTTNALPYTFENYAATLLKQSLKKLQVECQIISDLSPYLYEVRGDPPDWTIAFEDLLGTETPLCDILALPHFHWEHQSLERVEHLLASRYGAVGYFKRAANVHYLPFPVEKREPLKRIFNVILFEDLVEGKEKLIESFQTKVDVFGQHKGNNWLVRLKNREHVYLHMPLPYVEKLRALQMSYLAVIETEDPLYLPSIACGCLPVLANEVEYYLTYADKREETLAFLTEKLLPSHSWLLKTQELLKCLSQ